MTEVGRNRAVRQAAVCDSAESTHPYLSLLSCFAVFLPGNGRGAAGCGYLVLQW